LERRQQRCLGLDQRLGQRGAVVAGFRHVGESDEMAAILVPDGS
jgi:hypothetical protein